MNFKSLFGRSERVGMRPIPFLGSFLIVGLLFALQQWLGMRIWYQKSPFSLWPAIAGLGTAISAVGHILLVSVALAGRQPAESGMAIHPVAHRSPSAS